MLYFRSTAHLTLMLGGTSAPSSAAPDLLGSFRDIHAGRRTGSSTGFCARYRAAGFQKRYRHPMGGRMSRPRRLGTSAGVCLASFLTLAPDATLLNACSRSPLWLIRNGKITAARKVMKQIYGVENHPDERLAYEIRVIRIERELDSTKSGSYMSCFQGHNLKRTATVAFLYSTPNIGGAS
jgi:hypothetical protein